MARGYAYWNTPDDDGVTLRQRKWAEQVGVEPTLDVLAALPCLGGACIGRCVTCEARGRSDALAQRGEREVS